MKAELIKKNVLKKDKLKLPFRVTSDYHLADIYNPLTKYEVSTQCFFFREYFFRRCDSIMLCISRIHIAED